MVLKTMLEYCIGSCGKVERSEKWVIPTFLRVMGHALERKEE